MTEKEKTTVLDGPEADESKTEEAKTEDAKPEEAATEEAEPEDAKTDGAKTDEAKSRRNIDWGRVLAYGVLPGLALLLALTAGFLKYVDNSVRNGDTARIESLQVAKDSTVALLSYQPDKVEKQLNDARSLLTGDFQNSYTSLINDVVIPGAKQKQISAVATVPAAASVSADPNHAVVLVFVNQTVVVGTDAPTDTASSVRVTLQKSGDKWLISDFQPV